MSKKESEQDRYNRMKKIEKKAYIERKKDMYIDIYYDDYNNKKKNKKYLKNSVVNEISVTRNVKNTDDYDDYDYI